MSKATKRKHVTKEILDDFVLPEGDKIIVKILGGRGNNLHEVETPEGEKYLVSMPTKFRKNVWIKRGDFVLIQPIEEGEKVKAEIVNILYMEQIKYIQSVGKWPEKFNDPNEAFQNKEKLPDQIEKQEIQGADSEETVSSSDSDDDLFVNTNRPESKVHAESSENSESEEG